MRYVKLFEQFIGEGKMPDKYIGNDDIVYLKTKEDSRGANYNLYYKGHDIELGGVRFGSEKELKDFAANYILSNQWYNKLRYADEKPLPESFVVESGNAIAQSRPFEQHEVAGTLAWIEKNVFPHLGIDGLGEDAAVIGSAGKKNPGETSGDIDIAVSADKIAGHLDTSLAKVLFDMNDLLKEKGLDTSMAVGFQQVSIAAPIEGKSNNGVGQVDLMLSRDINWSRFMYHSPDFTKDESKYKGAYRNILLMSAIGKSFVEIIDQTEEGETKEYEAYVIRLNQGVVKVRKSFVGKRGLVKNAKLLKEFDKEITRLPEEIANLLFNGAKVNDLMTYDSLRDLINSSMFKFPEKRDEIFKEFEVKLGMSGLPLPEDIAK